MDYLDLKKDQRHRIVLFTGYILITVAIAIATLILVYNAYGFGIGKNGDVIQNGLTFFSSHPHPANIYIDGKLDSVQTNSRLPLPEGIYNVKLTRHGYRDWQRTVQVAGGGVRHFDYPFLIPTDLAAKKIASINGSPGLETQSPNKRWLVIQHPDTISAFDVYDLKNPIKQPVSIELPATVLTHGTSAESLKFGEWADDNQHLLLQHLYDDKTEYILLNRTDASQSINLNTTLATSPSQLTLLDRKYDQYYLYDVASATLRSASLKNPTPSIVQQHLLAYKSYGSDSVLFVTDKGAVAGQVLVKLMIGSRLHTLRSLPAGGPYLLDLTKYSGTLYVAIGETNQSKLYIYKDPIGQLESKHRVFVPAQVLHVVQPDYLSFSSNAQFIVTEHGSQFGVYDIENALGYSFNVRHPVDAQSAHATWMDGNRLTYVSNGKLIMFDYDGTNQQILGAANPSFLPAFAPDYKYVYSLSPATTAGQTDLQQTALLTPADL
jgi:hypothetical protein